MVKKRDERAAPFYMLYKGLLMGFDLAEAVFMVYMNDLSIQRNLGYNTVRSKRAHLGYLGIGARLFDRCVAKCVSMGLMQCEVTEGKYEYLWDKEAYACLVGCCPYPAATMPYGSFVTGSLRRRKEASCP